MSIPKWLNDPPRFARWHPSKATKFDHHLRTDEETYRFCVDLDIYWPNHLDNGHVLFALLPLRDSKFISELGYFWKDWVGFFGPMLPSSALVNKNFTLTSIVERLRNHSRPKHARVAPSSNYSWFEVSSHIQESKLDHCHQTLLSHHGRTSIRSSRAASGHSRSP